MNRFFIFCTISVCFGTLYFYGCATPMAPTGGEPDRSSPVVVHTQPETGTVNFSGNEIRFTFDKFIDRNSFRQNVSVEPDLGIQFEVDFRRKTAIVRFLSDLPENTTVAVQAGTDVTDTDRNKLAAPVSVAISTGPVLDDGIITARIKDSRTGEQQSGQKVFLYREPFDLEERAIYVAETDTSGQIRFDYISEGRYTAFWVNDINRNRIWDPLRERAQPFHTETFSIERSDSVHIGELYVDMPDTTAPVLDGVGLLSERRLRLRFSEEIEWNEDASIQITDSTGLSQITTAYPLYSNESDGSVIFAESETGLNESGRYRVRLEGFRDPAGNMAISEVSPFAGSSEPDTTFLQTISHSGGSGLFPDEPLVVTYSKFIDDAAVSDSLQVVAGDRLLEDWEHRRVERNLLYILPDGHWEPGINYQFRVWNPYEEEREIIEPEIWQRNQLGSLEFTLVNGDSYTTSHLILESDDGSIRADTTFTSQVEIDNLPPLNYHVRVFEDRNNNNRWDSGQVAPFSAPESYTIRLNLPVREGFTSEVELSYPYAGVSRQETDLNTFPAGSENEQDDSTGQNGNGKSGIPGLPDSVQYEADATEDP